MKVVANGSSTGKISDYGRLVYVPHPVDGFQLGRLVDIGAETLSVEMVNGGHIVKVAYNDALPCEEDRFKDVDDNCEWWEFLRSCLWFGDLRFLI